jgi:hypothetical protein
MVGQFCNALVGFDGSPGSTETLRVVSEARFADFRRSQPCAGGLRTSARIVVSQHEAVTKVPSEYALTHGFGLLILGMRGDRILRRSYLGRVAGAAAESAGLPVLLLSAR